MCSTDCRICRAQRRALGCRCRACQARLVDARQSVVVRRIIADVQWKRLARGRRRGV